MGDYSRLQEYIHDYFPDPIYSTDEVKEWAEDNVPAWSKLPRKTQRDILGDWENFIATQKVEPELREIREEIGDKSPSFWNRIKEFIGRLFR